MSIELEKAEAVVRTLEEKRAQLIQHGTDLSDERANVALAAHTGDAKARKRLDAINVALNVHSSELLSIDAALRVAADRVAEASRVVDLEMVKANAAAARAVLAEMRQAADDVDSSLEDFVESVGELFAALDKLHRLGIEYPTTNQLNSLGLRVTQTWIGKSRFKAAVELLPPSARRHMLPLVNDWAANVEASHIRPLLGEPEQPNDNASLGDSGKETADAA